VSWDLACWIRHKNLGNSHLVISRRFLSNLRLHRGSTTWDRLTTHRNVCRGGTVTAGEEVPWRCDRLRRVLEIAHS
jgi:hypothetical protein